LTNGQSINDELLACRKIGQQVRTLIAIGDIVPPTGPDELWAPSYLQEQPIMAISPTSSVYPSAVMTAAATQRV
jgi:hypothetical protein